jgi:hypothetical protein
MKLKDALYIGAIVATAIVWAYTSFATVQYVDEKHKEVKNDVEFLKEGQNEIKGDLKEIKAMVIQIYKEK